MKKNVPLFLLIVIFILYFVVIPLFPSRYLPELQLYEGELKFEGGRAYDNLKYLTEKYIRSIEKIGFDNLRKDRMYLIKGNGYVSRYWIWGFFIFAFALMIISFKLYLNWLKLKEHLTKILKRELPWIILILVGSWIPYLYWKAFSIKLIGSWPLFIHTIIWGLLCATVIIVPGMLRNKKCISGEEGIKINKTMIFLLTTIWCIVASIYINPFLILSSTMLPLFIMMTLSYKKPAGKIVCYIVFLATSLVFFARVTSTLMLYPYVEFNNGINTPYIFVTIPLLIWGVYFVSNPIASNIYNRYQN